MGVLERIGRVLTGPSIGEMAESSLLKRDVQPLEGTNMSLFNSQIPAFWTENGLNTAGQMFWPGNGLLAERTWITSRCLQMNAQQIASMPIHYEAPNVSADGEPAWISNPDPFYYPNGISDALFSLVSDIYGWGYGLAYVTNRYADGYPRNWTVIPAGQCTPMWGEDGTRQYDVGGTLLDPADVIQIDRNPGCYSTTQAHGTSAIRAYAQLAWGLLAAGNQAMEVNNGGVPKAVLKVTDPNRKLTADQAQALQTQWQLRTQERNGAPPVMPWGLDFESQPWNPKDMALIETQEFNALALAAAFGIPAVLLNMAIRFGMTYQNPGMLGEMWWRFELRPMADRIAKAFSAQALPSGQKIWFDAAEMFEPLGASRVSVTEDASTAEAAAQTAGNDMASSATDVASSASPRNGNGRVATLTSIGGSG